MSKSIAKITVSTAGDDADTRKEKISAAYEMALGLARSDPTIRSKMICGEINDALRRVLFDFHLKIEKESPETRAALRAMSHNGQDVDTSSIAEQFAATAAQQAEERIGARRLRELEKPQQEAETDWDRMPGGMSDPIRG